MRSKRLQAVAERVPEGARMADIGCDHAYLPLTLLEEGKVPFAIACDINAGPLEAARENARRSGIGEEKLLLRQGDGLLALQTGEVDVVTLAGMGASLMVEILEAAPEVTKTLKRIVVAPNVAPWLLRKWAVDNGFGIFDETVVQEGGHYYEVFALEASDVAVDYSELALYFGISLSECQNAETKAYFAARKAADEKLLAAWRASMEKHPELRDRYEKLSALWNAFEGVNTCN